MVALWGVADDHDSNQDDVVIEADDRVDTAHHEQYDCAFGVQDGKDIELGDEPRQRWHSHPDSQGRSSWQMASVGALWIRPLNASRYFASSPASQRSNDRQKHPSSCRSTLRDRTGSPATLQSKESKEPAACILHEQWWSKRAWRLTLVWPIAAKLPNVHERVATGQLGQGIWQCHQLRVANP